MKFNIVQQALRELMKNSRDKKNRVIIIVEQAYHKEVIFRYLIDHFNELEIPVARPLSNTFRINHLGDILVLVDNRHTVDKTRGYRDPMLYASLKSIDELMGIERPEPIVKKPFREMSLREILEMWGMKR